MISKGWPDFIFYNDKEIIIVEVKKKNQRDEGQDPSEVQTKCHEILKRHGINVVIERR